MYTENASLYLLWVCVVNVCINVNLCFLEWTILECIELWINLVIYMYRRYCLIKTFINNCSTHILRVFYKTKIRIWWNNNHVKITIYNFNECHYKVTITKYISIVILNLQSHNEQKLYLECCCENEVLEKEYLIWDNNCTNNKLMKR